MTHWFKKELCSSLRNCLFQSILLVVSLGILWSVTYICVVCECTPLYIYIYVHICIHGSGGDDYVFASGITSWKPKPNQTKTKQKYYNDKHASPKMLKAAQVSVGWRERIAVMNNLGRNVSKLSLLRELSGSLSLFSFCFCEWLRCSHHLLWLWNSWDSDS